ncbi:FeoB-associated Cys-rich membrane protein [Sphingobacterium suaedae]|uniref:FeoB-associated Cys-rich membrane protein n=1 Tax=Sphingobacterium suaedae TaxID=1686402 RepID=A0ABW5KCZ1_9SPHI
MDITIQYVIIAVVFAVALFYFVKRFLPSKNKTGSCSKGCGCSQSDPSTRGNTF